MYGIYRIIVCRAFLKPSADINRRIKVLKLAYGLGTDICHGPWEDRLQRLGLHSLQCWVSGCGEERLLPKLSPTLTERICHDGSRELILLIHSPHCLKPGRIGKIKKNRNGSQYQTLQWTLRLRLRGPCGSDACLGSMESSARDRRMIKIRYFAFASVALKWVKV